MKVLKWTALAVVTILVLWITVPSLLPMGKGSVSYARRWKQRLDACRTLNDVTNRFECLDVTGQSIGCSTTGNMLVLLTFTNGDWIVMRNANSHYDPWGGTVVTHDNTGTTRVFFGHVCGGETLSGLSLQEVYSNLLTRGRTEVYVTDR
jgi:hypothetical protein